MDVSSVNIIGILACTFIGMALGALWYSSFLFGKQWMRCIGQTPESLGSPVSPMIGSIAASFLTALGVSLIFSLVSVDSLGLGICLGLVLGFLIIMPALLSDNLFCGWGLQLFFIQSGYRILSILLMSLALVYL